MNGLLLLLVAGLAVCEGCGPLNPCSLPRLEVTSPDGKIRANCSARDTSKETWASAPSVRWTTADPNTLHTLVMVDPDAPFHPRGSFYLHWIVANIQGADLSGGIIDNGDVLSSYIGPAPPIGTGSHRYMLALYKQKERVNPDTAKVANQARRRFVLRQWLVSQPIICPPIAGNQFQSPFR